MVLRRSGGGQDLPGVRELLEILLSVADHPRSVVIDHIQEHTKGRNVPILFLYFDYEKHSEQTPFNVVTTLLRQLLSYYAEVPLAAQELLESVTKREKLPAWDTLRSIFITLCSETPEMYIVLDALDETDEPNSRGAILEILDAIIPTQTRLLVTSRHHSADINDTFRKCPKVAIEASEDDIRKFVLDKLSKSARISRLIDKAVREQIVRSIVSKSQGMYVL